MSSLFGKKDDGGRTVLVLDVESGSVGAALVRLSPHELPKVFGEARRLLPLKATHEPQMLADLVLSASREVLTQVAEVAARMRGYRALAQVGEVGQAVMFFSPPWGALSISSRELEPHPLTSRLQQTVESFFGLIPVAFEPFGFMAAYTTPIIFPSTDHHLLSAVSGEVTELILLQNTGDNLKIVAHATIPYGHHYPLRTLLSHGTISLAEARSAMRLGAGSAPAHMREALYVAGKEIANEFAGVAGELLVHTPARSVVVAAQEPVGEWFARALASSPTLGEVFPSNGEVRAVRPHNVMPHVAVHAQRPDLPLLMEALFVDISGVPSTGRQGASQARFTGVV